MSLASPSIEPNKSKTGFIGRFRAMASPCEVHLETTNYSLAEQTINLVAQEAWRIENKFSRYSTDNLLHRINQHEVVKLDDEFKRLLDFSYQCYELSDGLFDITSGILRRVWRFDGSDNIPSEEAIRPLLNHIGLTKLKYDGRVLQVPEGMELDLGGIGKEYAVDRCLQIAVKQTGMPCLVNFGGDLACNMPRVKDISEKDSASKSVVPWQVAIEQVENESSIVINLYRGALATSGDVKRFLLKDGIRYGHIINPLTGKSVTNAPHTITVAADTCIEAGLFSTLAILNADQAESFLQQQEIPYWIKNPS